MRKLLLILVVYFSFDTLAQSPNWLWAKSMGGNYNDIARATTADLNNNVYVAGTFSSSTLYLGTANLTNGGTNNVFLAKYDPNGNILWARTAVGNALLQASASAVTTDPSGNAYITGWFGTPSITFGSFTLFSSNGSEDVFIVKYDPNGNVLWAKNIHGSKNESGHAIHVSGNGVYITGLFASDTINIGSTTLIKNTVNVFSTDAFIAKYDLNGNPLWAKSIKGDKYDESYAIRTDINNNVFVAGHFNSPLLSFGTFTLTNSESSSSLYNVFIAKYDMSGNFLWAKNSNGTSDRVTAIATDASGNACITGYFSGDTISFGNFNLINNSGTNDLFIVKYSGLGTVLWAKKAGGIKSDISLGITSDASGNFLVTGPFASDTAYFETMTLLNDTSWITSDIFVAKYNASGNIVWVKKTGSPTEEIPRCISIDNSGSIIICGDFGEKQCDFDGNIINDYNASYFDAYLAKLNATVGEEELSIDGTLEVYPNPNVGLIHLKSGNVNVSFVKIRDVLGNIVWHSDKIMKSGESINLSNLTNGVYFILLGSNKGSITRKMILSRP